MVQPLKQTNHKTPLKYIDDFDSDEEQSKYDLEYELVHDTPTQPLRQEQPKSKTITALNKPKSIYYQTAKQIKTVETSSNES